MDEQQRLNFEKCERWRTCSAAVCPLYFDVGRTYHISGDARCTKLLDYLEGKEMPEALRQAIAESEPKWREALGEKLLETWLNNRKAIRTHFKKDDLKVIAQ